MEFERLIEAERLNDELLRRARDEAAAVRQRAEHDAATRRAALAGDLTRLRDASDAALARRRHDALTEIAGRARDAVSRYVAITDAEVTAVARILLAEMAGEGGPT